MLCLYAGFSPLFLKSRLLQLLPRFSVILSALLRRTLSGGVTQICPELRWVYAVNVCKHDCTEKSLPEHLSLKVNQMLLDNRLSDLLSFDVVCA